MRYSFRPDPHNDLDQFIAAEQANGQTVLLYDPHIHQIKFHATDAPNLLALGTRGTGKSLMIRWDAIMRCLNIPNFQALVIRRTMPELRRSHLAYIEREMKMLGQPDFLKTTSEAKFTNGSRIVFAHCENESDILNFLSSEYGAIYFDELSTFTLNQFLQISAAARAPEGAGYTAIVRAGSNPLGLGAEWMEAWFVTKAVRLEDYPDYHPDDFVMQFSTLLDNPSIDAKAYTARLKNLPDHVRRAWLLGEFVVEGAYFKDFRPMKRSGADESGDPVDWHVIQDEPTYNLKVGENTVTVPLRSLDWISVYRAIDWGYDPDPAVCLWIAVLPDKRAYVIKERKWEKTLATDVARDIKAASEGMNIIETFADPTMFLKDGADAFSIAEKFEQQGVPLTASINDRRQFGYAVHDHLNTLIDGKPLLRIVKYAAPNLIRTFPMIRTDKLDPNKMADGEDHYVITLAYFCMGLAMPSHEPSTSELPTWMRPKKPRRPIVG